MIYSYRRVSTDEQHNGPQAQADAISMWHNRLISCEVSAHEPMPPDFFDNGVSGSIPLSERPEGAKLIQSLKKGDTVVVSKLDRLFRSVADAASVIAFWGKSDISLVAIAEGFDMTNPYGRAMAQMASVFAELEREMIRSRTKAALASKKSRGECVGEIPYGWDKVGDVLKENVKEQHFLGRIKRMFSVEHHNAQYIANYLNVAGIPAKKGGKWSTTQVRRILNRAF